MPEESYNYDTFRHHMVKEDMHFRSGLRPGELAPDFDLPTIDGGRRFLREHPKVEHLALLKLPSSLVEFEESALERDLNGAKAVGVEVRLRREIVARVGSGVEQKEEVAALLARVLGSLPGTLADIPVELPRSEKGLLALAAFLAEQEESIRRRQARIEEIQQEIDRLAWVLYRPGLAG